MKVFEQKCIIDLALEKNKRQGKERIEVADSKVFDEKARENHDFGDILVNIILRRQA